jgi:predicted MFS family arabinose efflux permease
MRDMRRRSGWWWWRNGLAGTKMAKGARTCARAEQAMAARTVALVQMNRWVILAGFALLTACTQWLWLAYAPITTQTHQLMAVSEGAVGDLAVIFPLVYVILALPAGRWLDVRFGQALSLGAALTGAGGLLRLAGPTSYGWAMAGQLVTATGQPFVLNSITKVAARYFPARERTSAVSIGSVALYVGVLAAVLLGEPLLHAGGLTLLLRIQAAVAIVAALWVLAAVRTPAVFPGDPSVAVSLRWLRGDGFMWVLAGLLFVGMGVFNAVATWLDSILTHFGHGDASGALIAIMTVGGVAGGALLPGIVARRDQRRGMLEIAVVVTGVAFAMIAAVHTPVFGGIALFAAGFFLLAGLPVVLDWSELHAGPERAGAAAGFLLLAGNLGGVVLVLIIQAVLGNPYLSLGALAVACLAGLALATRLPARGAGVTRKGGSS